MKFCFTLGLFTIVLYLHGAAALPSLRRFFSRSGSSGYDENGYDTRDAVPRMDQHELMDTGRMELERSAELPANSDGGHRQLFANQIPPTILRKLRQRYGDVDPEELVASISRNPQAMAQLEQLGALDTRGKFKKLTGIAFILALLKIIF